MRKYIIKNCPAYSKDALNFCFAKNATQAICYNCTDCLLKQIVKKCEDEYVMFCGKEFIDDTLQGILDLLQIEEVE